MTENFKISFDKVTWAKICPIILPNKELKLKVTPKYIRFKIPNVCFVLEIKLLRTKFQYYDCDTNIKLKLNTNDLIENINFENHLVSMYLINNKLFISDTNTVAIPIIK